MSIKQKAYALAKAKGAKLEDDGWALQLVAPGDLVSGTRFVHTTCYPVQNSRGPWSQIVSDLEDYDFVPCDDLNCGADHRE